MAETHLRFAVILPHAKIFGGVKRFLEIGNVLVGRGHSFTLYTPDGAPPEWFPFLGNVSTISDIRRHHFDAIFATEPVFIQQLLDAAAKLRIFYAVLQRRSIKNVVNKAGIIVFANSENIYRFLGGSRQRNLFKCAGGIDIERFRFVPRISDPDQPLVIMAYGRFYRRKKGTSLVIRACERIYRRGYNVKLLLFDSPVDEEARHKVESFSCKVPFEFVVDYPVERMADLYHRADIFVSAERNAGWSNTTAEAMACGVPVIATTSGTRDFLIDGVTGVVVWRHSFFIARALEKYCKDEAFRKSMAAAAAEKIKEFTWTSVAKMIEEFVKARV